MIPKSGQRFSEKIMLLREVGTADDGQRRTADGAMPTAVDGDFKL
jgi:hypothetical protein